MQLNAQAINIILSTLSAEVQDEAIFNGQPPPESAHLIWTKLIELYGKSKCDDALEVESMENMSIMSSCSEEASQDLKSAEPEQEVQTEATALSASTYRMCSVSLPDAFGMAEVVGQQTVRDDEAQARWRPSDESTSVSHDTHHLCLMAKKSRKKASKKDQAKEIARVDDQEESDLLPDGRELFGGNNCHGVLVALDLTLVGALEGGADGDDPT